MSFFGYLTSYNILIPLMALVLVWILLKGRNKSLEARSLALVAAGGVAIEQVLRLLFHRIGPSASIVVKGIRYTFPSPYSFLATAVFGFSAYIILRHTDKIWLKTSVVSMAVIISFLAGLSPVYFALEFPSDVTAGYAFGGVWLSINIILLEIYRILPRINS